MNETVRPSAKIYQFPVKRAGPGQRNIERDKQGTVGSVGPAVRIEYGSSRYHDAAIAEDIKSRKF